MHRARYLPGLFVLMLLIGCGGPKTETEKKQAAGKDPLVQALNKTGQAYTRHIDEKGKGPASWEELINYAKAQGLDVAAIEKIKTEGYKFKWGARYRDATDGVTKFVLAQRSGTGPKLLLDGSIQID